MSFNIGQLNIPYFMAAGVLSLLIIYVWIFILLKQKDDRKQYFDFTFNILILAFITWKLSPLFIGFSVNNPVSSLFLPGGVRGRILGFSAVGIYTLIKYKKIRTLIIPVIGVIFILMTTIGMGVFGSLQTDLLLEDDIVKVQNMGFDLSDDKPVVINFWASWCPPCRSELPELNKFYLLNADIVEFYGVNLIDSEKAKVEDFIIENNILFPVVYDRGGLITDFFEISSIPVTVVIVKVENSYRVKKHSGVVTKQLLEEMIR